MTRYHFAAALGAAFVLANPLLAQAVDPNVVGPVRRAAADAGNAAGAPGVERRIEAREQQRDIDRAAVNPNAAARAEARTNGTIADGDRWRYRHHNNQWWYYTPQNRWMYYNNNAWSHYDPNTYAVPNYTTGGYSNNGAYYGRFGRRYYNAPYRGNVGPATTPYSNGTPAGNYGSNLGADIGAAANGGAGANTGAAIGGAVGNAVGAGNAAVNPAAPANNPSPVRNPNVNPAP